MIKYLGLTCGIFGLDGIIKKWIDERKEKPQIALKKFRIICCRNKGAMYSLGEETPDRFRRISAFILTGVAMHWIYVVTSRKKNSIEKVYGYPDEKQHKKDPYYNENCEDGRGEYRLRRKQ